MAQTKKELAEGNSVSHQEAIVKRMIRSEQTNRKKVIPIPGGKNMMENLDKRLMQRAVYNWLRGCNSFTEVYINLVKDPAARKHVKERLENFETNSDLPPWEIATMGKEWLSERMSKHLSSKKMLCIYADKDGLYALLPAEGTDVSPSDEDWEPKVIFTPKRQNEYSPY